MALSFEYLCDFTQNRMRMSNIYQPVMIRELLEELVRIVGESDASDLRTHRNTPSSSRRRTLGVNAGRRS
jgi:hypothetical protein